MPKDTNKLNSSAEEKVETAPEKVAVEKTPTVSLQNFMDQKGLSKPERLFCSRHTRNDKSPRTNSEWVELFKNLGLDIKE